VRRQHRALYTLLLFSLLMVFTVAGCSSHVAREDDPARETVQTANAADDDEEVVEGDDKSTLEEDGEPTSQKTAGFLMSIGYLAWTIGMTVLPLLMM